jgi:hypothetical protein
MENILPPGTTYNIDFDTNIVDIANGVTKKWTYPKGTVATILKHKLWREGSYKGVDYVVKMPDGYTLQESATRVHKILGLPPIKMNLKKK